MQEPLLASKPLSMKAFRGYKCELVQQILRRLKGDEVVVKVTGFLSMEL